MFEGFSYSLYSVTYVDSPAGHYLPERIETRKGHNDAPNRARASEIELVQATQSYLML